MTDNANIALILQRQAQIRPEQPAIIDTFHGKPRITSFAELTAHTGRAVTLLERFNLPPGSPVLVFQPMSLELYVALIALFQCGLVAMFLDPSAGREHIDQCCSMTPPALFIGSPRAHLLRLLSGSVRRIPAKIVIGSWLPGATSWQATDGLTQSPAVFSASADSPALLTFTSGSTGRPKAALRTHGFLTAQQRALEHALDLQPGASDLTTLPIFVLSNLAAGVTSVIPDADLRKPGAIDAAPVLAQIERHKPSTACASPAFFERICAYCHEHNYSIKPLQRIFTGGAPVFPRLMDNLKRAAPSAEVIAVYGSTEAEPIAHIELSAITNVDRAAMIEGKGLLTGECVDDIDLAILPMQWGKPIGPYTAQDFDSLKLGVNAPGEIVVAGDHVLPGYVNGEGDSETKFRVAGRVWHRTGDAGYRDTQQRIWLLGRCSARIEDNRGEIYPFAVECAALEDTAVHRAALVARKGKRLLVIEPVMGQKPEHAALRNRLSWANLDDIVVIPRIPVDKRHNAKVDYPALDRLLARQSK